jgi:hypothetical protein
MIDPRTLTDQELVTHARNMNLQALPPAWIRALVERLEKYAPYYNVPKTERFIDSKQQALF